MDLGLKGRVAIVTGGSEGIGKAAALSMAREGAKVAIIARRKDVLERAANEIRNATKAEVVPLSCDVRDESQVKGAVKAVHDRWGRIDILINNAGTSSAAKFESVSDDILTEDLKLKVYGAFYFSRAVLPHMKQARWGRIVNITTPGGKGAATGGSLPTSLSRAAGIAMTKAMSKDYAADNILVNTVCIGLIKSGQHERRFERQKQSDPNLTLEAFYSNLGKGVPVGRVGEAIEAGDLICFLASERASYISGTAINIDGGAAPII
ncbi:MAG: SDR family oxidoreductase [Chloroflexi bacterium]|nr:SDR family oxidoreductase [Chloroflexota bacterium]